MPRRLGLTLVAVLAGLALLTAAHAQVHFEGTTAAFPKDKDDEARGPKEVGFDLRLDAGGEVVFVLVAKDKGSLPNATTGFYGNGIPKNAVNAVDTVQALARCGELRTIQGGVTLFHDKVGIAKTADSYVAAMTRIGLTKVDECFDAGCHTVTFATPAGTTVRLRLNAHQGGVQVYFGV